MILLYLLLTHLTGLGLFLYWCYKAPELPWHD
jgi:hypothetical protein